MMRAMLRDLLLVQLRRANKTKNAEHENRHFLGRTSVYDEVLVIVRIKKAKNKGGKECPAAITRVSIRKI